jgi:hypothetical protein
MEGIVALAWDRRKQQNLVRGTIRAAIEGLF